MKPSLRLLLLGGSEEARLLAERLHGKREFTLFYSLAGRTRHPNAIAGYVRRGGFGGARGLAAWLRASRIDALVDATHPFAARISRHAAAAARECGVARLQLRRPAWTPEKTDQWKHFDSLPEMARTLPSGARVFLTLGGGGLEAFASRRDVTFLVRCIEPPTFSDRRDFAAHFPNGHLILARPPFHEKEEKELLTHWKTEILVCKNSGGSATQGKILAARELHLPLWLLRPPPPVPGPHTRAVKEAERWIWRQWL